MHSWLSLFQYFVFNHHLVTFFFFDIHPKYINICVDRSYYYSTTGAAVYTTIEVYSTAIITTTNTTTITTTSATTTTPTTTISIPQYDYTYAII